MTLGACLSVRVTAPVLREGQHFLVHRLREARERQHENRVFKVRSNALYTCIIAPPRILAICCQSTLCLPA